MKLQQMVEMVTAGDVAALSRLISLMEDGMVDDNQLAAMLSAHQGKAHIVGITGAPGVGKSTLINELIGAIRDKGQTVGIIAVDPSSPVTGGAILGDRVRMSRHFEDDGVFIRSMATRGLNDGLSPGVKEIVDILNVFGKDYIIVETVGIGQVEVGIRDIANTVILVVSPGSGDYIQLMKAGPMEIADIVCVNKTDQAGADELLGEISNVLAFTPRKSCPVIATQATTGKGISSLLRCLEDRYEQR
jgi:GTPase